MFFIRNLGFCSLTAARQISFEDALRFEQVHAESYRALGYDCVFVARGELGDRVEAILRAVKAFE